MTLIEVDEKTYATGWAAELLHGDGSADLPAAVLEALPERVLRKLAANVELTRRLALAERERDEAAGENGRLHQRVALQHETIRRLRATGQSDAVMDRIDAVLAAAPCACLARPETPAAADTEPPEPKGPGGRWRVWFRRPDGTRWSE